MLNSLYKYTSFRPEFFENLLMRGTQKYALNDPFEMTPAARTTRSRSKQNEAYFDYAVFSLSETKNNLLMWSHYADEHKGIVIEFDFNKPIFERKYFENERVFSYHSSGKGKYEKINADEHWIGSITDELYVDVEATRNHRLINPGVPHRVLYNPERPTFNKVTNILEHFLVKSDAWIYEKEHRIILPLIDVDLLNVNKSYNKHITGETYWLYPSLSEFIKDGKLIVSFQDIIEEELTHAHRCIIDPSKDLQTKEMCDFEKRARYEHSILNLSKDPTSIFLYKLDPRSIKSIIIGARMSSESQSNLINALNSNPELNHVELYKSGLSPSRFELQFKLLNRGIINDRH